jgi:luciferase family oxidoreductase group 1
MLQHYSPYKVAENFHVLESLAPNRVDLGIGRAPGGLPHSTKALQQGNDMRPLFEKLIELEQFLHDKLEPTHPLHGLKAQPIPRYPLHIYLLGASTSSASVAANLGFSYVFAQFINSDEHTIAKAFKTYQQNFNMEKGTPHPILAVSVIVTDTDEEAKELAADAKIVKIHLESGKTLTLPSVEKAEEYGKQAGENYTITTHDANIIHGSQETVRNTLLILQQTYHLEEFIITTPIKDFNKRLYSYKILKDAFSELIPR